MINIKFVAPIIHTFSNNELENIECLVCQFLLSKSILIPKLDTRDFIFWNLCLGKESFPSKDNLFKHEIVRKHWCYFSARGRNQLLKKGGVKVFQLKKYCRGIRKLCPLKTDYFQCFTISKGS